MPDNELVNGVPPAKYVPTLNEMLNKYVPNTGVNSVLQFNVLAPTGGVKKQVQGFRQECQKLGYPALITQCFKTPALVPGQVWTYVISFTVDKSTTEKMHAPFFDKTSLFARFNTAFTQSTDNPLEFPIRLPNVSTVPGATVEENQLRQLDISGI